MSRMFGAALAAAMVASAPAAIAQSYLPPQANAAPGAPQAEWHGAAPPAHDRSGMGAPSNYGCDPSLGYGQPSCDGYGAMGTCPSCPAPAICMPRTSIWNVSAGALFLTREAQDSYAFSYDSANEDVQLVDAADADMDFSPGVEATVGWYDLCRQTGWQLNYWQLFPEAQSTQYLGSALGAGSLDGIRNYDQLNYSGGGAGDGPLASDNVNDAEIHRLARDWEIYNVEANRVWFFQQPCCGPWQFTSLVGFRFFKFRESLLFVSDPNDTMITGDPDEYRIDVRTDNQLYGFQLGGIAERCCTPRLSLRLISKAGLFGNHATLDYFEGGSAGAAVINNGPNAGQMMRVNASDDDLAFLGELGVGFAYRVGCRWRVGADYRVIGVTGLALPTDQIYFDTRGINDVRAIDNDGSLLLHGAFVHAEYCF
ncbi:MAG: BBP7 family outer membrane beta-barrel protein [Pirellulales bacterium]|nr:BBP7 family outer membrane beta-barrel protein [Pirellulales bacterium]